MVAAGLPAVTVVLRDTASAAAEDLGAASDGWALAASGLLDKSRANTGEPPSALTDPLVGGCIQKTVTQPLLGIHARAAEGSTCWRERRVLCVICCRELEGHPRAVTKAQSSITDSNEDTCIT